MRMKNTFILLGLVFTVLTANAQKTDTIAPTKSFTQQIPGSNISFLMQPIPAGSFTFGSQQSDKLKETDETPAHKINLPAFWMGAYEVTYEEYNAFFSDITLSQNTPTDAVTRPSSPYIDLTLGMGKTGNFPANSMQQYGAIMYCKWLYQKTGVFYRLPTEAEWEYACKANSKTVFPFGDNAKDLDSYAWYKANSGNKYQKVGLKKPNAWGLYDMLGNVSEWVLDQYQDNFFSTLTDTTTQPLRKPEAKFPRIVRGGSFRDEAKDLRSANRTESDLVWNRRDPQIPKSRWWNADAPFVGFRIMRPVQQPTEEEADLFFKTYLGF